MISYKTGIYTVKKECFSNKLLAFLKASELKSDVTWNFHDEIFSQALGKFKPDTYNLDHLYKLRALQLRDSYDYLILHYSGGSDSWNILNTFLKNNIKLDQIFIKWPLQLMDKGLYQPNTSDKTAINFVSEWDFVIKKDIQWLKTYHPEIKIEVIDWLDNLNIKFFNDDLIQSMNLHRFYLSNLLRFFGGSKQQELLLEKGKKVASIFGVDKPLLVEKHNKVFFKFSDTPTLSIDKIGYDNESLELFYWTPDLPILAIQQAYELFKFYKLNPHERIKIKAFSTISNIEKWDIKDYARKYEDEYQISKAVLYPDWDISRFQAEKPIPGPDLSMSQKDIWLETQTFMKPFRESWSHIINSYHSQINNNLKLLNPSHMKFLDSKWHYLGDF